MNTGVKTLLGDPKRAVLKLSIPMIVSNLVFTLYNLADGVWVAGLGRDALSAVGIFFPLFFTFISLSIGIGVGTSSAISRRIGAKDKTGAENVAMHSLFIGAIIALSLTLAILRLKDLLETLGAKGNVLILSLEYSKIVVWGSFFLVFNHVATGILNGEGSTKKTMYSNIAGSLLNIILDPIFIYSLKLGIAGAAYATLLSMAFSSVVFLYWLLRKSYIKLSLKGFKVDIKIAFDILRTGIPSSLSLLLMSIVILFINLLIIRASGHEGVAVYTSAWRIINFGSIPAFGIASALTAIVGASYGARDIEKLKTAYLYAIKLTFLIEIFITSAIIISASKTALIFTYSRDSKAIYEELVSALRILPLFLPFLPFGVMTSSLFQGIGKGERSFVITLLRALILELAFAYLLGFSLKLGLHGIWTGMVLGNAVGALLAFAWGSVTVRNMSFQPRAIKTSE
ncbi:MAG: MATE family efflux transporter [Synergistetes bacterium]|nr:MAG: Putative efflux protein, MATE family [bacterium 42_11]MBC7330837.1 MATE family efflux transporter [Synergistota bacterium]